MADETNTGASSVPQKELSLDKGTEGYKKRVRARKGMDAHEQRQDKQGKLSKDFTDKSEDVARYNERIRNIRRLRLERLAKRNYGVLTTAEREVMHQMRKMDNMEKVLAAAQAQAEATPTLDDDKFVASKLPGMLEKEVYDISVDDDFDYPGARTLRRFG